MTEGTIRDPALYEWRYFLRSWGRDSEEERARLALAFQGALTQALGWVGQEIDQATLSDRLRKAAVPGAPQISERLTTTGWRSYDGQLRELAARTLLDTYYIEAGQVIEGEQHPESLRGLLSTVPPLGEPPEGYVGNAFGLYGEADGDPVEDDLRALAVSMARTITSRELRAEQLRGTLLQWGYFALVDDPEVESVLIVVREAESPEVGRFLHSVLPQVLLSRVKARVVRTGYYSDLLPRAREAESALDSVLKEAAQPRLGLEKLEAIGASIARGQATLIEAASSVEESIETLGVASRNLELVLQDPTWSDRRPLLEEHLRGDLLLLLEQMKTDLRYFMITRGQADLALQSLQTTAGVRGAQWERRLALLLAIFTFGGVAQVFPELAWGWRLGIVFGGIPLVGLGYLLLRR